MSTQLSNSSDQAIRVVDYQEDLVPGSRRLYIFFGGIAGGIGMLPSTFMQAADILGQSRIFIRDPQQAWYQRGVPGLGDDIFSVAGFLARRIDEIAPEELRFVGNCMGGYAAMLFCSLLRKGRAIAFAPQTFISLEERARLGETRAQDPIDALHRWRSDNRAYDLKAWLTNSRPSLSADIYVSTQEPIDAAHARELEDFPNITVFYIEQGGHAIVQYLCDLGQLKGIMAE